MTWGSCYVQVSSLAQEVRFTVSFTPEEILIQMWVISEQICPTDSVSRVTETVPDMTDTPPKWPVIRLKYAGSGNHSLPGDKHSRRKVQETLLPDWDSQILLFVIQLPLHFSSNDPNYQILPFAWINSICIILKAP